MTIEEALYSYLSGYATLTALISKRIYPDILPQNCTLPAMCFSLVSESEVDTFEQPASTLIEPTYQFDIYGSTRKSANAVAAALRTAFKNYSGLTGGAGGVTISAVTKVSKLHDVVTDSGGAVIAYRVSMDFEISYLE